jgi:hypothetical protein
MAFPVVTIVAGGLPVVDVTATAPKLGLPVSEAPVPALPNYPKGLPVTKVAAGKPGLAVTYV